MLFFYFGSLVRQNLSINVYHTGFKFNQLVFSLDSIVQETEFAWIWGDVKLLSRESSSEKGPAFLYGRGTPFKQLRSPTLVPHSSNPSVHSTEQNLFLHS